MISINLIDNILDKDPSFCRGRIPRFIQYSKSSDIYLYSHNKIIENISTPRSKNYGIAIESKSIMPFLYNFLTNNIGLLKNKFTHIFTFDQSLIDLDPELFKWCPASGIYIGTEYGGGQIGLYNKKYLVSMVSSNKNWVKGHKLRLKLAQTLQSSKLADVFGNSVNNPITHINDAYEPYLFTIVIENDDSDGYFTEKILNPISVGTVPIYWGCKDINKYLNINGIIKLDLNLSIKDIVGSLNENLYISKKKFIEDNLNKSAEFLCPEDYIWEKYLKEKYK
jgi:hypothetical protein